MLGSPKKAFDNTDDLTPLPQIDFIRSLRLGHQCFFKAFQVLHYAVRVRAIRVL